MADYSESFQIVYDDVRHVRTIRFHCFDTINSVAVYDGAGEGSDIEGLLVDLWAECLDYHRLWSFTFEGSDIWRINEPVSSITVDPRTALLVSAMKAFHIVEPVFDFTVGPVSFLWKHAESVPNDEQIAEALEHVGAEKVAVEGCVIVKADPLVQVDVGGAAKGFVADAIAARLRMAGVESAEIELGGNLYMVGCHPEGRPWRVAMRVPYGPNATQPIVEVRDQSVVTSGGYERFVEIDGKRYQHIVDAATGRPTKSDLLSATAISRSSLQADMLATTALLAGSSGLDALKTRHPDAKLIVMTRS